MRIPSLTRVSFLGLFLVIFCAGSVPARPINTDNREVPYRVDTNSVLHAAGSEQTSLPPSSTASFAFTLTAEQKKPIYGLLAAGNCSKVLLNGRPVDILPLDHSKGKLFLVDPMYLVEGTNQITLNRPEGIVQSWAESMMFSLLDGAEEAHFAEVFTVKPRPEWSGESGVDSRQLTPDSRQADYDVVTYDFTWKPALTAPAQFQTGTSVLIRGLSKVAGLTEVVLDFDYNVGGNSGVGNNGAPSGMVIDSVTDEVGPALSYVEDTANNLLIVTLASPVAVNQQFTFRVAYHGYPNDNFPKQQQIGSGRAIPLVATTHGALSRPLVYTATQPYGARRIFPCKDDINDKTLTTVYRIIVPNNLGYTLKPVTNGERISIVNNGDNTETHIWEHNFPIATYLISLTISDYEYVEETYRALNGFTIMPVGHYIFNENLAAEGSGAAGTVDVMEFFAQNFGEYPFLSDKYVTSTWGVTYAIEHQTCTSMPAGASAGVGNGKTRRNIHELSHQWFGDKVSCANLDHLWLHEGFATYCEALYTEYEPVLSPSTYAAYVNSWIGSGISRFVPVVGNNSDTFDGTTIYRKGAWVLHMLRGVIGKDALFTAMKNYAAAGYVNATSQPDPNTPVDFQSYCEQAAGLSTGALDTFFDQWLYGADVNVSGYKGEPIYRYSGSISYGSPNVLSLTIDQAQGLNPFAMPIRIMLTDDTGATSLALVQNTQTSQVHNIDVGTSRIRTITFDHDNWILDQTLGLRINTVGLPYGAEGIAYSTTLNATGGTGTRIWSLGAGAPAWLSITTGGVLSGTPPSVGDYSVPVTVKDNNGAGTARNVTYSLLVPPEAWLVINEIDYDQNGSSGDNQEFIELYSGWFEPLNLSGYKLELLNAIGSVYDTINLTGTVEPGALFVVGSTGLTSKTQDMGSGDRIQNGACDAIRLKDNFGRVLDSFLYESGSNSIFYSGPSDGFEGAGFPGGDSATTPQNGQTDGRGISLGRYPDGTDFNDNWWDFYIMPPSPGSPNEGLLTLPYQNDFGTPGPLTFPVGSGIYESFVKQDVVTLPVGVVDAGTGDVTSPNTCLTVVDKSGGGDEINFGGAGNLSDFHVSGYWWLKSTPTGGSAGEVSVITVRNSKAIGAYGVTRDSTNAFGYEGGVSVSYSCGIVDTQGLTKSSGHISVDFHNQFPEQDTNLALVPMTGDRWVPFDIKLDYSTNVLSVVVDNTLIHAGPLGGDLLFGGVALGYRFDGTYSSPDQAGFFDGLKIDVNVPVSVSEFLLE